MFLSIWTWSRFFLSTLGLLLGCLKMYLRIVNETFGLGMSVASEKRTERRLGFELASGPLRTSRRWSKSVVTKKNDGLREVKVMVKGSTPRTEVFYRWNFRWEINLLRVADVYFWLHLCSLSLLQTSSKADIRIKEMKISNTSPPRGTNFWLH